MIGIAAYRVWINTPALSGGAGKIAAADEGRMNALEALAHDCTQKGSQVTKGKLYDYVRRIRLLLEEPLKELEKCDVETIRSKRTVLMQRLFTVPGSFARAAVATSKPVDALEIACQKRAAALAEGKSYTCAEFNTSIKHLKKDANIIQSDGGDGQNGESNFDEPVLDAGASSNSSNAVALPRAAVKKTEKFSGIEQILCSQISNEAKRVKLNPEQVKGLYVSFLQAMLSTVEDMGVEK